MMTVRAFPCGLGDEDAMTTVQQREADVAGLSPLRLCCLSQDPENDDRYFP
jgi:hypothetical protein